MLKTFLYHHLSHLLLPDNCNPMVVSKISAPTPAAAPAAAPDTGHRQQHRTPDTGSSSGSSTGHRHRAKETPHLSSTKWGRLLVNSRSITGTPAIPLQGYQKKRPTAKTQWGRLFLQERFPPVWEEDGQIGRPPLPALSLSPLLPGAYDWGARSAPPAHPIYRGRNKTLYIRTLRHCPSPLAKPPVGGAEVDVLRTAQHDSPTVDFQGNAHP